jgi:hypothetical protein
MDNHTNLRWWMINFVFQFCWVLGMQTKVLHLNVMTEVTSQ